MITSEIAPVILNWLSSSRRSNVPVSEERAPHSKSTKTGLSSTGETRLMEGKSYSDTDKITSFSSNNNCCR